MRALAKYGAFVRMGIRLAANDRGELYARMLFFAIILGIFSALWRAVADAGLPLAVEPGRLVWYLAATEWILLSPAPVHVEMEGDIRRGDIACQLARPCSYLGAVTAQAVGRILVRAPVLALVACAGAFAVTGRVPNAYVLTFIVPFGLAAMLAIHGLYVVTGLMAFWIGDVSPVFWIWQKLLFILGGLMLPLSIYPGWLQQLAAFTPFPFLLARPASFVIAGDGAEPWNLAWHLAIWIVVIALVARALFARAVRSLQLNGG